MAAPNGRRPVRTCVGCRQRFEVDRLVRVALDDRGRPVPGRTLPGRGVWLCAESERCLERALRARAFSRGLRRPVDEGEVGELAVALGLGRSGSPATG